jgi:hypothetical protein
MAPFHSGGDMSGAVADLEGIAHIVGRFDLGTRPRPPIKLSRTQQPGGAQGNGLDIQFVERTINRFVGQMPVRLPRKLSPQRLTNLLRTPPPGQTFHDELAQLAVAGQCGETGTWAPALGHLLSPKRVIASRVRAVTSQLPADR